MAEAALEEVVEETTTTPAEAPANEAPPAAEAVAELEPKSQAYWPDDWQQQIAKGDEKLAKLAGRYTSPEALLNALKSAQDRIRSGDLKPALPKDASEEEVAKWREENGLPAKPSDYEMPVGLTLGDEDKPIIEEYLKVAHDNNLPPEAVKSTIDWWYKQQQAQADAMEEADRRAAQEAMDALHVEWGTSFRRNMQDVQNLIGGSFPQEAVDILKNARGPDGSALFNNPDVVRGFAQLARELNPAGTVVPGSVDQAASVDSELAQIEKTMRENRPAYNKDDKMQARYRELLVARERYNKRG